MILAIDIGNSVISFAAVDRMQVKKAWSVKTTLAPKVFLTELNTTFNRIKKFKGTFNAILICSVVPRATQIVSACARKTFSLKPLVIGENIKVPVKNLYRNPSQVGQDRLVCAYAAMQLYKTPCIIVDFGTAITFDVVSKKGEYLGGSIIPGLRLYAESLFEKTALLPKVAIRQPREIIGRDTQSSILSGIFYGYGALCDGMVNRISDTLKAKPPVIITGGYTPLMNQFITITHRVDERLIFKGIWLIYKNIFL